MSNLVRRRLDIFIYASSIGFETVEWPNDKLHQFFCGLPEEPCAERLAALIYKNANQRGHLDQCPAQIITWLKKYAFAVIVDFEEKKAILRQLANTITNDYPTMILIKGMAVNDRVYAKDAPRGTSDIDLLISPDDKNMFKNAFANLASEIEFKPQKNFDGLFEKTWQSNCKPRVYFDVHWYLSYPNLFDFDHSKITERSTAHPLYERQKLRVLSNEDQLVNLAIHLMRDCDFYDYGLLDCHEIIHSQNVDLELTVNIAKGWGAKTCLFYLFWLCNKHLNTSIAAEVLAHIKPNSAKHVLCKWLMKNLLVKPTVTKTYNHRLKQLIVVFLFIDRPLKALRFYLVYALKGLLRINMKKN